MGITEAETILASRPDLDHVYQTRFLGEKLNCVVGHFKAHGLPSSSQDIGQAFKQSENLISTPSSMESQTVAQGLGDTFKLGTKSKSDVKAQLASMSDQLNAQKDLLEKQLAARKKDFESNK